MIQEAIKALGTAEGIASIEFFVIGNNPMCNGAPKLECRLPGLPLFSGADYERLAGKLNAAIKPVIDEVCREYIAHGRSILGKEKEAE